MALNDKVVVVTGGARGMGRAYVQGFLDKGARVAALDLSWVPTGLSADHADEFGRHLLRRDDALALTCDITDSEQIEDAFQATLRKFGTVDVVINNACLLPSSQFPPSGDITILETRDSDWETAFEVSVFGTLKVTRAFIRPMLEQKRGSIIAVSSGGGNTMEVGDGISWTARRPFSREMPYQSAKAAVTALFCYLADEVKEHNVAVNVINPAGARTTGWEEKVTARQQRSGEPPRRAAKPEHVVPLALFLAEQEAKAGITGRAFDTIAWNEANGFGGMDVWAAN
jgi:NAD(P)-dependent dehydrogenase (short-subunit alcohol dehydrogenase family)